MARRLSWTLFLSALALAGCGGSPSSPTPTPGPTPAPPSGCSYTVTEPPGPVAETGGELALGVTTSAGCAWNVSSTTPFITVTGAQTGSGSGTARFSIGANAGVARQGQVSVAGRTVTVVQAGAGTPACAFNISPTERTVGAGATSFDVGLAVTSGQDCAWTAESHSAFLTVPSAASGSGNATIALSVAANSGASRIGTATIAGRTSTVLQEGATAPTCAFTVSPPQSSLPAAGGAVTITVTRTSGSGCVWIAQSQSTFITVTGGSSGTDDGSVAVTVAPNGGGAREGSLLIAGRTVLITQAAPTLPCALAINPTQVRVRSSGGSTFSVVTKTQGDVCPWTAQSQSAFVTINGASSGVNDGGVIFQVAANPGPERMGTVLIAGQTFTIIQGSPTEGCTFDIQPTSWSTGPSIASMTAYVRQLNGENCTYTAVSSDPFVTVEPASALIGPVGYQPVTVWAATNTGAARTATVTVGSSVLTVSQAAATPATTSAVLAFTSDPGDPLAQGQSQTLTYTQAQFNVVVDQAAGTVTFGSLFQSTPRVSLTLSAPLGQPLAAGYYPVAQRTPSAGVAGVNLSYDSRGCNTSTGRLQIQEIAFGSGNTLQRLHARFETFCGGQSAGLHGTIWIDAAGSTTPPALPPFPAPGSGNTFFSYQSEPGDVLGQGGSGTFTLANATFTPSTSGSTVSINVASIVIGAFNWNVLFGGPAGLPGTGTYDPASDPAQPGAAQIRVIGRGLCTGSTLTGKFTVVEAVFGPGGTVQRFHATFEVRCGAATAALRGEIRVLADPWR